MRGMPKEKLLMGIGTYGHTFTLQDAGNRGMGAPASPGPSQEFTRQNGFASFYEVGLIFFTVSYKNTVLFLKIYRTPSDLHDAQRGRPTIMGRRAGGSLHDKGLAVGWL